MVQNEIIRLPAYLVVNFVRFYFKKTEKVNAKIRKVVQRDAINLSLMGYGMQDVKFPFELDMFEFCSAELRTKLAPMRAKSADYADAEAEALATGEITS